MIITHSEEEDVEFRRCSIQLEACIIHSVDEPEEEEDEGFKGCTVQFLSFIEHSVETGQ
jgi:hypothetical protein